MSAMSVYKRVVVIQYLVALINLWGLQNCVAGCPDLIPLFFQRLTDIEKISLEEKD